MLANSRLLIACGNQSQKYEMACEQYSGFQIWYSYVVGYYSHQLIAKQNLINRFMIGMQLHTTSFLFLLLEWYVRTLVCKIVFYQ